MRDKTLQRRRHPKQPSVTTYLEGGDIMMDIDDDAALTTGAAEGAAAAAQRFDLLRRVVQDNPTDYNAHLSLVGYLREERPHSLDLLKGRESFAERFPLSPELWEEWIEDRKASGGDDMLQDALALYRRAFEDYQCGKLWTGYLEALEESLDDEDPSAVEKMREAFEEALGRVGVNPMLGGAIWKAYLLFETAEFEFAEETGADKAEVLQMRERVKRLYRRQLAVPLVGNDEVLSEMSRAFSDDEEGLKEASKAHARASKMLVARLDHEKTVARCQAGDPAGAAAAGAWEAYAAFEAADGHPAQAALVLERAESEGCCLHERIWITHSDLLMAGMGTKELEAALTARAVRNLPWSAELWCRRLRSLERLESGPREGQGEGQVRSAWREALACALPSPDDYVKVLLAYCAYVRRRLVAVVETAAKPPTAGQTTAAIGPAAPPNLEGVVNGEEDEEKEGGAAASSVMAALDAVRGAFEEAEAFVEKNYPGWHEGWLNVVRQRIHIEDEVVDDLAALELDGVDAESQARKQWERVLRHSGKRLAPWLEAVAWERRGTGDHEACRRLFARAMREVEDFPEAACSAFLTFEQEIGSLETWDLANKQVFNHRAGKGSLTKDLPLGSRAWTRGAAARPLHQPSQRQRNVAHKDKRSPAASRSNNENVLKRVDKKRAAQTPAAELSDAEFNAKRAAGNKRARTAEAAAAAGAAGAAGGGAGRQEEGGAGYEPLTAFVVNLDFHTTDAILKEMFSVFGEVTGTRLPTGPNGRAKGVGYVTFKTEDALSSALALNGVEVGGRVLKVERSLTRSSRPSKTAGAGKAQQNPKSTGQATVPNPAPEPEKSGKSEKSDDTTEPGAGSTGVVPPEEGGGIHVKDEGVGATAGTGDSNEKKKGKQKSKKKGAGDGDWIVGAGGLKWPVHPTTVFVKGLGSRTASETLKEAFSTSGAVAGARVVEDRKTHEKKDYGYVQFEGKESVEKALELDGTEICGGTVKISRSVHPAIIPNAPPSVSANTNTNNAESGETLGQQATRPNDWKCPNPDCENLCFGFRTKCNRCGTGKDGTPPPRAAAAAAAAREKPTMALKPRLQLGSIRPRVVRRGTATNGEHTAGSSSNGTSADIAKPGGSVSGTGVDEGGDRGAMSPPPSAPSAGQRKTNADFRAMFNK